jgi:hypothetical protein
MRIKREHFWWIFGVFGMLTFVGCGGGSGGSGSSGVSGGTGFATIQGSVPGTVFVAVDDDTNLEVGRVTATGTQHTFSMDVPTEKNYRFYVMENEGTVDARVYPMYVGANNVFALDSGSDGQVISLGMVSPNLGTGRSTPANGAMLLTGLGATTMVPPSLAGSAFSMDDVNGTSWGYNTMMTSGTMGWEHGTLSFDNNGLGHMTGIVRNGAPLSDRNDIPYHMSLSGMLLNSGDSTFQCVVSGDMSVIVGTFTDNTGGPAMMIAQKRGGEYTTDDMTGTWRFQRLTVGGDNTTSGWAYGTMAFVSGNASITSMTTNAGPGGGGTFLFSMDGNGIMTEAGGASFYGVMSMDKSMIVATDSFGGDPEMWILMKDTAGTWSPSDMTGDWVMHAVSSGNPGSRDWTYGHSVIDGSGNDTFSQMMGSLGPVSSTQMTFQMNDGVMTTGGMGGGMGGGMMGGGMMPQTFHGIMNEGKNIMVSTYTDGSGGYPVSIQVK